MTKICLIRHGQTNWNLKNIIQGREDIPLNKTGEKQANQSGNYLSNEKWDIIISSPLIRAKKTETIIGEKVGIFNIHLDDNLIERDFGVSSGQPVSIYRDLIAKGEVKGIETDEELIDRCLTAFHKNVKIFANKRILMVLHSHTIKAILMGINPKNFTFRTTLNNSCLNYIEVVNNEYIIKKSNFSEHLLVH